jgi:cardiolipin synthase
VHHSFSYMGISSRKRKGLSALAITVIIFVSAWLILFLFRPQLHYKVEAPAAALDSQEFAHMLESVTGARLHPQNKIQVLANGENFYKAELEAIAEAQHSVNIEAYIFERGEVSKRLVDALIERAQHGVKVKVVIDAVGSFANTKDYFESLTQAGGQMNWYHPLRWYNWDRVNNRTHRELIVIDGKKAFIGGAGFADHWLNDKKKNKRWRDTMVMVDGPVVSAVQGTFVENWLRASGEVISGTDYFPVMPGEGSSPAMVINSSATTGGSTRARILFQILLASAKHTIYVSSPYFLPDSDIRDELLRAVRRGVTVKIITPGVRSDHAVTRSSSRRLYGDLLKGGVQISEYQPAMIHAKILIVDGQWSVVGSTNMDNRSFEINDEVNLAAFDGEMCRRLTEDFMKDLESSRAMTYDEWKRRPLRERITETLGELIQRQQ